MSLKEFRQGFFIVWAVLSLSALLILLAPHVLPEGTIYNITPVCESKRLGGGQCPLCGMTTAFIDISKGDFTQAHYSNRAALALYGILLLNQLIFWGNLVSKRVFFRKRH